MVANRSPLFSLARTALLGLLLVSPLHAQRDDSSDSEDRERSSRRSERYAETLKSWDANGDGYITQDEAPGRAWDFLKRRASASGKEAGDKLKIADLLAPRKDSDDSSNGDKSRSSTRDGEPATPGFTASEDRAKVAGFGEKPGSEQSSGKKVASKRDPNRKRTEHYERAVRYAGGLMSRYDRNRNGQLERDEWRRISGSPEKSDANNDGIVTRDELIARVEQNFVKRSKQAEEKRRDLDSKDKKSTKRTDSASKRGDPPRSYRFTPAHERLPDGLPGWFHDRDANRDGQVSMHEYSRSWTKSRAAEFARHDKDGDGILTPAELVEGRR